MTPMSESLRLFFEMLRSSISMVEFMQRTAYILEKDPIFIPGYLEHIWTADERHDSLLKYELIEYTKKITRHLFTNVELQKKISDTWTNFEMDAFKELLEVQYINESTLLGKMSIRLQQIVADYWFDVKKRLPETEHEYVKLMKVVDIEKILKEINRIPPYWWNIETRRAAAIPQHQHTHTIVLRKRMSNSEEYIPVDGVHESFPTPYIRRFPNTYRTIMDLADDFGIALGRVVIVRLPPNHQAYRHYDAEAYLFNRNRYHLVLSAGENNILSAGPEVSNVKPGEVWYFANKVMHRAHNKSNIPRLHVIFDGYPLNKKEVG